MPRTSKMSTKSSAAHRDRQDHRLEPEIADLDPLVARAGPQDLVRDRIVPARSERPSMTMSGLRGRRHVRSCPGAWSSWRGAAAWSPSRRCGPTGAGCRGGRGPPRPCRWADVAPAVEDRERLAVLEDAVALIGQVARGQDVVAASISTTVRRSSMLEMRSSRWVAMAPSWNASGVSPAVSSGTTRIGALRGDVQPSIRRS